jgi:type IV pilus assembly protein PilV
MRTAKFEAGVMLIEALIGILIFSIGILALLGMQGTAIKNTTDARYRSEASFFASQIAGQMWVDLDKLPSYDTANPQAYPARDDWMQNVANMLPGIDLVKPENAPLIEVGPNPALGLANREVRVQVFWRQPGETETRRVVFLNRINSGKD